MQTQEGFELRSYVPEADAMSTAPRRHQSTALQNWPGSGFTFMGQMADETYTYIYIYVTTKKNFLQGCQMVYLQTKNFNSGMFWRSLEWDVLVQFIVIWNILPPFGILYGPLVIICHIFPSIVML
jgi:hypothetical protein